MVVVFGALMLGASVLLFFQPGLSITEAFDSDGYFESRTTRTREVNDIVLLLGAVGLMLLGWGVNGRRISAFTVGPVSAEMPAPEVRHAQESASQSVSQTEVKVKDEKETEPPSNVPASGKVYINNETELVYPLGAVPFFVIEDLLKNWPKELEKPESLTEFEFASRKRGRGNIPWLIKFQGLPIIKVSYGGHGKQNATVAAGKS